MTYEQNVLRAKIVAILADARRREAEYAELVFLAEMVAFFPGNAGGSNRDWLTYWRDLAETHAAKVAEMDAA